MIFKGEEKLALRVRRAVKSVAEAIDLRVDFAKGRRQSDILVIKVSGTREHAHAILHRLATTFPEIDVDILKAKPQNTFDPFILVVTQSLNEQSMAFNERRSKLISKFAKLEENLQSINREFPPPDFNDVIFLENL